MTDLIIFIGDIDESVASIATATDASAMLIDCSNYQYFLDNKLSANALYTSLGDLPANLDIIYDILDKADKIVFCPPKIWSDRKTIDFTNVISSIQGLTEYTLFRINSIKHNVYNLDLTKYHINIKKITALTDIRKSDKPQLWVAGGSDTAGYGINSDDRYGIILANKLKMPCSILADNGVPMSWIADQILRSDIRSGDIVIVGTVPENRLVIWSDSISKLVSFSIHSGPEKYMSIDISKSAMEQFLVSNHMFYENITHLYQIVNFCRKVGAKPMILGLMMSHSSNICLTNIPEFIKYTNLELPDDHFIDHDSGGDGGHPGPKQHQLYADFCQSALKQLNYIN